MKKRPDLKLRLNELRGDPEPPVEVTLRLEAEQYGKLQAPAHSAESPVAAYVVQFLHQHIEQALSD